METPNTLRAVTGAREVALSAGTPNPKPYAAAGHGSDRTIPTASGSHIVDYYRLLYRYKWAVILSALAGLVAGFVAGIPMTPIYRARISLEVLNLNEEFMNMKRNSPVSTADPTYDVSEAETQTKLLQSNAMLDRVIDRLDPAAKKPKASPKAAVSGWRSWMHLPEPVEFSERQKLLSSAARSLKVRTMSHTRVIDATVESTDPALAAQFANTLAQEFIQQNLEAKFSASHTTGDWLKREINDARANLKKAEDDLQAYARNSGLIFSEENSNVATEKLQQLQQQLSGAIGDRIAKQARFDLARKSPPAVVSDVLADPALKETASKINDLKRQIAELSTIYNPEFSRIKQAQAQLQILQGVFERNRADILKRIENDYEEAVSREKLLAVAYDGQAREVVGQDEKAIQYNILKREVDSNRKLYDTMLQQTKESAIVNALRASNVRVADPATVPEVPFFPNFRLNSVIGMALGLIITVTLITTRERADRTLQQPGDVKLWTDLLELGAVPAAGSTISRMFARPLLPTGSDKSPANGALGAKERLLGRGAASRRNRSGAVAEAFRSVLSSILFAGKNGEAPQILVFTSAHPSDGKTTTVSNIAVAAAEIRRRVLVIDADLRRPRIHDLFGVSNEPGLADILREDLSAGNPAGVIRETGIANLNVLPAGEPTNAAAHLLHSRNMAALLARVRHDYDMILIDTPPMLEMTDARVVGRLGDGVILVARSGKTTRDSLIAAKERLEADSIRVLGSVLNDWDPKKAPGGYYGHYRYSEYSKYKSRYAESSDAG